MDASAAVDRQVCGNACHRASLAKPLRGRIAPSAGSQIKQMVDFIKLEAKEKASEIRMKVGHFIPLLVAVLIGPRGRR